MIAKQVEDALDEVGYTCLRLRAALVKVVDAADTLQHGSMDRDGGALWEALHELDKALNSKPPKRRSAASWVKAQKDAEKEFLGVMKKSD